MDSTCLTVSDSTTNWLPSPHTVSMDSTCLTVSDSTTNWLPSPPLPPSWMFRTLSDKTPVVPFLKLYFCLRTPFTLASSNPRRYWTSSLGLITTRSTLLPEPISLNIPALIASRTNCFPSSSLMSGTHRLSNTDMAAKVPEPMVQYGTLLVEPCAAISYK